MTDSKTATEQFAQLVEDYGDVCDLRGASSTRACEMFGLIRDKYEQAIAAMLGNSKSTDAITELRKVVREAFSGESVSVLVEGHAIMRAIDAVETATLGSGTLTAEQVRRAVYAHSIHVPRADADWQAIADELNATLGSGECESRWFELFGTPEKAAMTMAGKCCDCCECVITDECKAEECLLSINDDEAETKLLEWLRGKAVER